MTTNQTSVGKRSLPARLAAALLAVLCSANASAAALAIADVPVFLNATNAEPLVMLALSNDEQLYHKAYTDFDDVDGDGVIDSTYKDTIGYYGYFDPAKCYSYSGNASAGTFGPTAAAGGTNSHSCNSVSGGGRWSGNFLNWATMARVDALRKVLFGGFRSTDTGTQTILERTYLPNDNHSWAKFYSAADLAQFTPYDIGTYPSGITMCNVTPQGTSTVNSEANTTSPRFRVANGQWTEWAAQESRQCLWQGEVEGTQTWASTDANASPTGAAPNEIAEFTVRVQACVSGLLGSEKCKAYGSSLKPVGLLQDFADADQLKIRFGLMTGTYGMRKSGGVLRKNVARFTDEVSATDGTFTGVDGIVKSINLMRISRYYYNQPGYFGTSPDSCPFGENSWSNGSCSNWGNPLGEIYLEALRYYVGSVSPTPAFASTDSTWIPGLNSVAWVNPYGAASTSGPPGGGASVCAKPNVLPISTSVLSFDNNDYGTASDLPGLNINSRTDAVGTNEGIAGNKWFVGSLGDGTSGGGAPSNVCTSQTVSNLSQVTGICPQAGGLQGSFAIAGLAAYAHLKNTSLQTVGTKKIPPVDTYAVALSPPLPAISIPVGNTTVTLRPAAYNLRDSNAMQLVNFRVISQAADNSTGVYFMNFENAPAGSDYDNDEKGYLEYFVSGSTIKVVVYQSGSSAGATQKMGYIIDGVSDSGTYYLVSNNDLVADKQETGGTWSATPIATVDAACKVAGYAASPATVSNEECHYVQPGSGTPAPKTPATTPPAGTAYNRGVKTHTAGGSSTGQLQSPLWYAAKYGGFKDIDGDGKPSTTAEWDANGDGIPDNYFLVTNPALLETQLSNAFTAILAHAGSASAASVNSGSISSTTRIFQATFDTSSWGGHLFAFQINTNGSLTATPAWDAATKFPAPANRAILTVDATGAGMPFEWTNLSAAQKSLLYPADTATIGQLRLNYLRGDRTQEQSQGGAFRNRDSPLGDIVNSSPAYMGPPVARYRDSMETAPYSAFRTAKASRTPMVYVGSNDGILHAFDASANTSLPDPPSAGTEKFAFIPSVVFPNLYKLTSPSYTHLYYADGSPTVADAFYGSAWHTVLAAGLNKGGREIYALDVTNPGSVTESTAASTVLWEFTSAQDADLGYTFSRPVVIRMHNGAWAAVFGNGYNSTSTGHAILFVVNIQTGALIAKIDTNVGSSGTPNGLSTPFPADVDGDGIVDYVYAGDLRGNMWKFNVTNASASSWAVAYTVSNNPAPLFTATDSLNNPQPITERPVVGFGPGSSLLVLFGTGQLIQASDRNVDTTHPMVQSFYGIIDANTGGISDIVATSAVGGVRTLLLQQTILAETSVVVPTLQSDGTTVNQADNVRAMSHNKYTGQSGWYLDLQSPANGYEGERSISDPILRGGELIFTTAIPNSDPCAYGGRSWLMDMDSLSGGQLSFTPLDLNNDKKFNDADLITITYNGSPMKVPASGIQTGDGISTSPGMVSGGSMDYGITTGTGNTGGNGSGTDPNPNCTAGGNGCPDSYGIQPYPGAYGRQSWRQLR
jgi:type IV pilus assembly protein PilY1